LRKDIDRRLSKYLKSYTQSMIDKLTSLHTNFSIPNTDLTLDTSLSHVPLARPTHFALFLNGTIFMEQYPNTSQIGGLSPIPSFNSTRNDKQVQIFISSYVFCSILYSLWQDNAVHGIFPNSAQTFLGLPMDLTTDLMNYVTPGFSAKYGRGQPVYADCADFGGIPPIGGSILGGLLGTVSGWCDIYAQDGKTGNWMKAATFNGTVDLAGRIKFDDDNQLFIIVLEAGRLRSVQNTFSDVGTVDDEAVLNNINSVLSMMDPVSKEIPLPKIPYGRLNATEIWYDKGYAQVLANVILEPMNC
jgi:hypothetical protein